MTVKELRERLADIEDDAIVCVELTVGGVHIVADEILCGRCRYDDGRPGFAVYAYAHPAEEIAQ